MMNLSKSAEQFMEFIWHWKRVYITSNYKRKNYAEVYLLLCVLCMNCTNTVKTIEDNGIKEINIIDNLSNYHGINIPIFASGKDINEIDNSSNHQKIKLSTIASNIEYIALETNKNCLIANMAIYSTNNKIVANGDRACYVFERKTGSFIRQIASFGQGPGEYTEGVPDFWDAKNEQVCFWGHMNYMFYNLDGTFSHQVGRFRHYIRPFVPYEDFYVGYVSNRLATATSRIAFYDKKGILVDSIPNYRSWKRTKTSYGNSGYETCMYLFNNSLYYKDIYCDTLYQIKDFELHPRYVFNTGGLAVPYEIQEGGRYEFTEDITDKYEKYINIIKILEDNRYLYITFDYRKKFYRIVYDKKDDNKNAFSPLFVNDLDGGFAFWPEKMISDNEMMCVFSAEQLLTLDKSKITDEKLKNILNNLQEDDNPVVAIVTLKE